MVGMCPIEKHVIRSGCVICCIKSTSMIRQLDRYPIFPAAISNAMRRSVMIEKRFLLRVIRKIGFDKLRGKSGKFELSA